MAKTLALLAVLLAVLASPVYSHEYNETLARELVDPAGSTYCPQKSQFELSCGPLCDKMVANGYKTLYSDEIKNNAYTSEAFSIFYKQAENQVIVSFRGTAATTQLFEEFVRQTGVPYKLQSGFGAVRIMEYMYDKYTKKIRSKLLTYIAKIREEAPDAEYIFIGHSLGGAYATLSTFDFANNGMLNKSKIQSYTYGSPRVGNYDFAKAMRNTGVSNFRIVNSIDFAPHSPPCNKNLITFECIKSTQAGQSWSPYHVDTEIYYKKNSMKAGEYKVCSGESNKCAYGLNGLTFNVDAHLWYFGKRIGCEGGKTK